MNTMVFLEDTLNQLQSFSTDEKQWLADKLYEQIREEKKKEKLVFPHISKGIYQRFPDGQNGMVGNSL